MAQKILDDRENKMGQVEDFFKNHPTDSLVSIKANLPGLNKNHPYSFYLVKIFYNYLNQLFNFTVNNFYNSSDGPYYLLGIRGSSINIKKRLIFIESTHPLGRLIDLDYFQSKEKSVSRSELNVKPRRCFLCNEPAVLCIRNCIHKHDEITTFIENKLISFMKEKIGELIDYSIIRELKLEDKFGLVSFYSCGSHSDMDYQIMIMAKDAILDYFKKLFIFGNKSNDLSTLLSEVRQLGIDAENKMLKQTGGVNCYKGIIFLLGLVVLATGYTLKTSTSFEDIFVNVKKISHNILADFNTHQGTFGTNIFKKKNITGVRGIAFNGLKVVRDNLNKISPSANDKDLRKLLFFYMSNVDDTVFIKRSLSYENYLKHKKHIKTYDIDNKHDLNLLNQYCLENNLSFGGSADLLILSIFLVNLKEYFIL